MTSNVEPTQSSGFKVKKIEVNTISGEGSIVIAMQQQDADTLQKHINIGSHISVNLLIQAKGPIDLAAATPKAVPVSQNTSEDKPTTIEGYTRL